MTARRRGHRLNFYYQADGKKYPLGKDLISATALYHRLSGGQSTPNDAEFGGLALLSEREIAAACTPFEIVCGVYFLLLAKRIVYIGQSANVWRRILEHYESGREFDAFCWQSCQPVDLAALEAYCIQKYRPPYNASKPSFRTVLNYPVLSD
jgi:hypothetical protein